MEFTDFIATEDDQLKRLDRVVKRILGPSCSNLNQTMRKGLIKLNKKKCRAEDRVNAGDLISIAAFLLQNQTEQPVKTAAKPVISRIPLEDVFKNTCVRIINKPYGISSQPSQGQETDLSRQIQEEFESQNNSQSLSFRTGPLHRLDRNTTGLLAFSQNSLGARYFTKAMENHEITKTYIGVVQGALMGEVHWEDFILQHSKENLQSKGGFHTVTVLNPGIQEPEAKKAVTKAFPLAYGWLNNKKVTLVQFNIYTGRKHQIRSQSAFHGLPLCGDRAYGARAIDEQREYFLHAVQLHFPEDNPCQLPQTLTAPLHKDFQDFLKRCLINWDGQLII